MVTFPIDRENNIIEYAGIARLSVESSSSRVTHSTTPSCV